MNWGRGNLPKASKALVAVHDSVQLLLRDHHVCLPLHRVTGLARVTSIPGCDPAGGFGPGGAMDYTSLYAATGGAPGGMSVSGFGAPTNDFGDLQASTYLPRCK